jgi:hypothetical protein
MQAYYTYSFGRYEPDFMSVNPGDFSRLFDFLYNEHKRSHPLPPMKTVEGRRGLVFMNAILVSDDKVPVGRVRFENGSQPDNPKLNGEIDLVAAE